MLMHTKEKTAVRISPGKADKGAAGVASTPYEDDAAEFRPAFKKVLSMATAYAAEGSNYYQNPDMLKDMINIMDYLCTVCYTPEDPDQQLVDMGDWYSERFDSDSDADL